MIHESQNKYKTPIPADIEEECRRITSKKYRESHEKQYIKKSYYRYIETYEWVVRDGDDREAVFNAWFIARREHCSKCLDIVLDYFEERFGL